jgi:hypothetical protein
MEGISPNRMKHTDIKKEEDRSKTKDLPERPIPSQAEGDEETVDESLKNKEENGR